jgi:hypothetical protein
MYRVCLILFFIFCSVASIAQNRMAPGYVVLENNDTLKGYIQLKGFYTAPDFVHYTKDPAAYGIDYSVKDCKAFGTSDEVYQRWIVKMDMSCMSRIDFNIVYEDSTLVDTVFLKRVFKGNSFALYKYYRGNETGLLKDEKEKMHFFLYDNEKLQELIISYKQPNKSYEHDPEVFRYRLDWTSRQTRMFFRDQLLTYFDWGSERRLKRQVDNLLYEEASLVKALESIDRKFR